MVVRGRPMGPTRWRHTVARSAANLIATHVAVADVAFESRGPHGSVGRGTAATSSATGRARVQAIGGSLRSPSDGSMAMVPTAAARFCIRRPMLRRGQCRALTGYIDAQCAVTAVPGSRSSRVSSTGIVAKPSLRDGVCDDGAGIPCPRGYAATPRCRRRGRGACGSRRCGRRTPTLIAHARFQKSPLRIRETPWVRHADLGLATDSSWCVPQEERRHPSANACIPGARFEMSPTAVGHCGTRAPRSERRRP